MNRTFLSAVEVLGRLMAGARHNTNQPGPKPPVIAAQRFPGKGVERASIRLMLESRTRDMRQGDGGGFTRQQSRHGIRMDEKSQAARHRAFLRKNAGTQGNPLPSEAYR